MEKSSKIKNHEQALFFHFPPSFSFDAFRPHGHFLSKCKSIRSMERIIGFARPHPSILPLTPSCDSHLQGVESREGLTSDLPNSHPTVELRHCLFRMSKRTQSEKGRSSIDTATTATASSSSVGDTDGDYNNEEE